MRYLNLFGLEIAHAYYADGRCLDFQIDPTSDTQKLLTNLHCVLKPSPGGVRALVPVDSGGMPLIALPANPVFAFHLRLQNPNFNLYTDMGEINQAAAPLFTNSTPATSGELSITSAEAWATEQFAVRQPGSAETFILAGKPLDKLKAAAFIVNGLSAKSSFKSYDPDKRLITINSAKASIGAPFTVTYPVTPRLKNGVFADVEIKFDSTPAGLSADGNIFKIVFKPGQALWKYYLVLDRSGNKTALPSLEDKDNLILFAPPIDVSQMPDPADVVAIKLAEQFPGMQCFRFVSKAQIPCQQAVRKNIQLQVNGEKVINALPNPPFENYSFSGSDTAKVVSLYQIVKYFTH